MYCIDAARVVTDSKLVVQLQKSDEDQVKRQHEERLTNPCWMSAELLGCQSYEHNFFNEWTDFVAKLQKWSTWQENKTISFESQGLKVKVIRRQR